MCRSEPWVRNTSITSCSRTTFRGSSGNIQHPRASRDASFVTAVDGGAQAYLYYQPEQKVTAAAQKLVVAAN
jgi:hypothetical protein